jgi:sugar lactone lactonase YvrE
MIEFGLFPEAFKMIKTESHKHVSLSSCFVVVILFLVSFIFNKPSWCGFDFDGTKLPLGFKANTYLSGTGFDPNRRQNVPGLPAIVSFTFDPQGNLYFARTANRLWEIYGSDTAPIYRIPLGKTLITTETEKNFFFGPSLQDPDDLAINQKGEIFVSTKNWLDRYGSVYRLTPGGEASLFAGGPPGKGAPPLFMDPEGISFDQAGNVYVIDVELGKVVKFNADGKLLNPEFITGLGRGRALTFDHRGFLWVGTDGPHATPHMDGSGRIYRASLPDGKLQLLHSGPLPSGMSLSPAGNLFAAQRRSGKIFALTPDGKHVEFATFTGRSALRTLAFPPVTKETQKAGIAGDLFVMVFPRLDYPVREIIRISGPFDVYVKKAIMGN